MSGRDQRRREMAEILGLWAMSGQSLRSFAEEQRESYWKLRYWKKKLGIRRKTSQGASPRVDRRDLVPVDLVGGGLSADPGLGHYTVRLQDGTELVVPPSFSSVDLVRLVRVVKSC